MAIQVPLDAPFGLHVTYAEDAVPGSEPISVAVSNPDVASVGPHPGYPGDPGWVLLTPVTPGAFVTSVYDGSWHAGLGEMVVVTVGESPPIADQEVILG